METSKTHKRKDVVKKAEGVLLPTMTWIDLRRIGPSSEELEKRRALLGLVNKLTFTNMETISSQMVSCMQDPYLIGVAAEMVLNQALNPAWMTLFAHLCSRLAQDSPVFGRHREINFRALFLQKYRTEFEQVVYIQVPSLMQLCAKCVSASMSSTQPPPRAGALTQAVIDTLLPEELVSYLQERPWVVTVNAREQRWRRMIELIILLGELYNVHLVEGEEVHSILAQLCESIENGIYRNVEPLCKLLMTVGPKLRGQQVGCREYLNIDQDAEVELWESEEEDFREADPTADNEGRPILKRRDLHAPSRRTRRTTTALDMYMAKAEMYQELVRERKLGQRLRFMIDDLLEQAQNWRWG